MRRMAASRPLLPAGTIENRIVLIRGQPILLDRDLAALYEVTTASLNQAVGGNLERFPPDFMFRLTPEELAHLISQSVTSSWGGTRKPPRAFTEQGVAMLSGILNSDRAIRVNLEIMRTPAVRPLARTPPARGSARRARYSS